MNTIEERKANKGEQFLEELHHTEQDYLEHRIHAMYDILGKIMGLDRLEKDIEKMELREAAQSQDPLEQVYALQRLVFRKKEGEAPQREQIPDILLDIEEGMADMLARMTIESRLEQQVARKIEEKQKDYIEEMKLQLIRKEAGPDNANTLLKYALLEKQEKVKLSKSALDRIRPHSIEEIVGQERAVKALITKLATPFPQHVIIYGPPGVGKTTAARLVLEMAGSMGYTPFQENAPFVELDGTTLRWDPREITNPLLGAVHDPIYQGSRRELAETGIPEPKTGLVTEAHGGVLFIDEIGELDLLLQNKLLKVLEDKRVYFDSSYYDPNDSNVPKYVKKLFDEGAPADFILIGATTREPEEINLALRSRCAEVFFEPLKAKDIQQIVINAGQKIHVEMEDGVAEAISRYTMEGRKAINILTDAYGMALYRMGTEAVGKKVCISMEDLMEVVEIGRLTPVVRRKAMDTPVVGKIFGLGVRGFLGQILELEAVVFPSREKGMGKIYFNDTAGSMAKDSVTNAAAVVRRLTGKDIHDYDIHVNSIGGGNIDGPSAGVAILLVILSALENRPLRQDLAVTGEISIRGRIMPVGGLQQKVYAALRAGMKQVLVPKDNYSAGDFDGIEIVPVETIEEAIRLAFDDRGSMNGS
ncbi:MAG: Lon family ATP-dependent protease [Clostridia bacterium]